MLDIAVDLLHKSRVLIFIILDFISYLICWETGYWATIGVLVFSLGRLYVQNRNLREVTLINYTEERFNTIEDLIRDLKERQKGSVKHLEQVCSQGIDKCLIANKEGIERLEVSQRSTSKTVQGEVTATRRVCGGVHQDIEGLYSEIRKNHTSIVRETENFRAVADELNATVQESGIKEAEHLRTIGEELKREITELTSKA